ncbi:methionine--tRNA ligase subunit beta, partial [Candidatus Poribacteria bacterium]
YRPSRLNARYHADLANDLGNLLNRVLGLVGKHFKQVPEPTTPGEFDDEIKAMHRETLRKLDALMETFAFDTALETLWEFVRRINRYIQQTEVWTLNTPEKRPRMGTILYNALEALRIISVLISPFMPETADKIQQQLNLPVGRANGFDTIAVWGGLPTTLAIARGEPIFPRIDKQTRKKKASPTQTPKQQAAKASSNLVSFSEFQKLELRAAKVLAAEPIEGADRLLKLRVDLGAEKRQVVAGIAEHYTPETLIGKQVIVVTNLEPATIRGVASQGMLLAASGDAVVLATLEMEVPLGTQIR